jgi:isopenicillin-N N-acyltransferase-like protein
MMGIRILELNGSPFEMGYAHGEAFREDIREYAEERVRLSGEEAWTGRRLSPQEVLDLGEACLREHQAYAPDLVEEFSGLAEATGLSPSELVIVGGFTDFIDTVHNAGVDAPKAATPAGADNCTAFIVPDHRAESGRGFFGQTWDMHASSTKHVILLRGKPRNAPAFLAFTTVGCLGMIGMNEAGIAVGINNLLGADGQVGVTWPFVVRKILQQTDLEAALTCLLGAKLAGAHNYLLFDDRGRGYNVEAMASRHHVTELEDAPIVHTNHCLVDATHALERRREPASQGASEKRLVRGQELLDRNRLTVEDLQELTRDRETICVTAEPPRHVETCGAAIMRPTTGDFWAVWGLPTENEYEHFTLA